MPKTALSSTSSSSHATAPRCGKWLRVWLAAGLIAIVLLGGLEIFLRRHGYQPSVRDTKKLWAHWRHRARFADSNIVVLLGSSRMLLGFSPAAWREEHPGHRVVQLAINGGSALPVLRDLANTPTFRGTVLCEVDAWQLIGSGEQARAQGFVDYYRERWVSPFQDLEVLLRVAAQARFTVTIPGVGYRQALQQLLRGQRPMPKPFYLRTHPDRCFDADYSKIDCRQQEASWIDKMADIRAKNATFSDQDWRKVIQQVRTLAAQIEQRGGKVIFVRFPTSGNMRAADERLFPRTRYWDELAVGLRAVHFEDVPALGAFVCPEGSHLDMRDKQRFTRALAKELALRHWIQAGEEVRGQSLRGQQSGPGPSR